MMMQPQANVTDELRQKEYADFFRLPNLVFKLLGYNVIRTEKKSWRRYFDHGLFAVLLSIHIYYKYFMFKELIMLIRRGDIMNVIRLNSYVVYSIDANVKFLALNLNLARARQIYTSLQEAYPSSSAERVVYQVNKHYWSKSKISVIVILLVAAAFIAIMPLVQSLYVFANTSQLLYLKPIPMEYSFQYDRSVLTYGLTFVLEFLYIYFTIISNVGTDLWLIANVVQVCMHLEYIQNSLKLHEPHQDTYARDCRFLASLIRKHQQMFFLISELNKMFGVSLSIMIFSTTGLLCVLAVQLSIEGLSMLFFLLFIFMSTVFIQFGLICQQGEKLINIVRKSVPEYQKIYRNILQSQDIALAAYGHKWYNGTQSYKKLVLFLMLRAQKQAAIVAKAFQPINLDSFKMVVNMTYRVFTVVQTMMN